MNSRVFLFLTGGALLILTVYFVLRIQPKSTTNRPSVFVTPTMALTNQTAQAPVDYKAGFAIFTNNTYRVFTATMYHNLSKDVFIQADNPAIIHVKKGGTTWDDFFKTLPFKLTKDCLTTGTGQIFCNSQQGSLKFYLNGVKTDDLLKGEIKDSDRALISYGQDSENEIKKQLEKVAYPKLK